MDGVWTPISWKRGTWLTIIETWDSQNGFHSWSQLKWTASFIQDGWQKLRNTCPCWKLQLHRILRNYIPERKDHTWCTQKHTHTHTHTHESHFLGSSSTLSSPLIGSRSLLINPHGLFPATHQWAETSKLHPHPHATLNNPHPLAAAKRERERWCVLPGGASWCGPRVSRPGANHAVCTTHDVHLLQLSQGITNNNTTKLINEFFTIANKNLIRGNGLCPLCPLSIKAVCDWSKIIAAVSEIFVRFL